MTFEEMSIDDKIDNLKMRIRGFKNRYKETLYKEDGRNKNITKMATWIRTKRTKSAKKQ